MPLVITIYPGSYTGFKHGLHAGVDTGKLIMLIKNM